MKFDLNSRTGGYLCVLFAAASLLISGCQPDSSETAVTDGSPQSFATAEEAARAIIDAAAAQDIEALGQILGAEGKLLISTGTPAEDRHIISTFAELAQETSNIATDPGNENLAVLNIGDEDWPFAIPLVRENGQWFFDAARGADELIYRRIGANELDTIEVCRGYVVAQQEYATEKHDGSSVNQYAQKIISSPGKRDGLAWRNEDGTWGGPIGENAAQAIAEGYTRNDPWHGYYYKILTRQGPAAPLGEMDYVIDGAMIGGFGLAAAPAEYGVTGVMTFIVSNDGVVYEKDFGPDSLEAFNQLDTFDPDETWTAVPLEVE